MSSYIVDQQTMHRIITHIDMHRGKIGFGLLCRQLMEMGYDLDARSGLEQLGSDLFALNERAVDERYGLRSNLCFVYVYQHERASDVQVLKSVQCLLYQCSEGDVSQTKLFEWLESYEHSLMRHLIDG